LLLHLQALLCTTVPANVINHLLPLPCPLHLQALEHYGESIRVGHKHILQSLPRLLTLYFEFGSKVAASKAMNQKMRNTHTQVRQCCCLMRHRSVETNSTVHQQLAHASCMLAGLGMWY
jgi:hypothetical protein